MLTDIFQVDWTAAASQFNPSQKSSSFKALVTESMRKIEKRLMEGINGGWRVDRKDISPVKKKEVPAEPKTRTMPQATATHRVTKKASKAKGKAAGKGSLKRMQADSESDEDLNVKDEDAMDK